MQGQKSGASVLNFISGAYENRDKQGVTYAVVGQGKVVIGGEANPVVLGEIKRDPAGRQIVTVDDRAGFKFDIPLVDLTQLIDNVRSTVNLLTALSTPVPENVAAMGPVAKEVYRGAVARGISVAQLGNLLKSGQFEWLVEGILEKNPNANALEGYEGYCLPCVGPAVTAAAKGIEALIILGGTYYVTRPTILDGGDELVVSSPFSSQTLEKVAETIDGTQVYRDKDGRIWEFNPNRGDRMPAISGAIYNPTNGDLEAKQGQKEPGWFQQVKDGIAFDQENRSRYAYNQVYVQKPGGGYYIMDSYGNGENVSRKNTQFSIIQETTAINYLNEMVKKYNPDAIIANVPSTINMGLIPGQRLGGNMLLEVPVQKAPIPQSILDKATNLDIKIRDINGKIYNQF